MKMSSFIVKVTADCKSWNSPSSHTQMHKWFLFEILKVIYSTESTNTWMPDEPLSPDLSWILSFDALSHLASLSISVPSLKLLKFPYGAALSPAPILTPPTHLDFFSTPGKGDKKCIRLNLALKYIINLNSCLGSVWDPELSVVVLSDC